jgi:hypothetical protein
MIDKPAFLSRDMIHNGFSDHFIDLVNRLIELNPKVRLGSLGISEIKAHPFFKGFYWDRVCAKKMKPPFTPHVGRSYADKSSAFRTIPESPSRIRSSQVKSKVH